MDKVTGNIYQTMDYSKFNKLPGNRKVLLRRKAKILKSINEIGYVRNPIVINENHEIIDGQGRFEALKELGLSIEYVVAENAGLKECVGLNLGQTNWKPLDYVESYAEQGVESYIRFLECLGAHHDISLQILYGVATNTINVGGAGTKCLKNGELEFSEEWRKKIEPTLDMLETLSEELRYIKGEQRIIWTALAWCLNNTDCDSKRLHNIMQSKYPLFHPVVNPDMFLNELSDIYNKNLSARSCMYFNTEYKQALKASK